MTKSKSQPQTFEQLFLAVFDNQRDMRTAFNDFVTAVLCTLSMIPNTMDSYYEDAYEKAIEPYKNFNGLQYFPALHAKLITEMNAKIPGQSANDVLGSFFEKHIASDRKGQFFTPWPICELITRITYAEVKNDEKHKVRRILDSCCGSGRLLMSSAGELGVENEYYGIDIDHLCVKMTVINLFLNGVWKGELMCADALNPHGSFRISYILSGNPLRVYWVTEKEQSPLWRSQVELSKERPYQEDAEKANTVFNSGNGGQLSFF